MTKPLRGDDLSIHARDLVGRAVPREPQRAVRGLVAEARLQANVAQHVEHAGGMRLRIVPVDEEAGCAVVDDERQAADARRDDRRAARLRFERDEPERFRSRRDEHDVGRRIEVGEPLLGLWREEHHAIGDAERRRQVDETIELAGLMPARAADDRELQIARRLAISPDRVGDRTDRDVRALVRLQPSNEQRQPESR